MGSRSFSAVFAVFAFLAASASSAAQTDRARAEALAKLDRDRIASHARTLAEMKREQQTLRERQAQLATARAAAEKASAAAQRAAIARNDLIRDIDRRRDLNAQLAGELQSAQQRVRHRRRRDDGARD